MNTQLLSADHPNAIPLAVEVVRAGGLVVFPTDTLYGVGCDPCQPAALQKIYAAKGRSAAKAIPVLISSPDQLESLVTVVSSQARRLMESWWPGALTLVLPKNDTLPLELTPYPGLTTDGAGIGAVAPSVPSSSSPSSREALLVISPPFAMKVLGIVVVKVIV